MTILANLSPGSVNLVIKWGISSQLPLSTKENKKSIPSTPDLQALIVEKKEY